MGQQAVGQRVKIHGTVFDQSQKLTLEGVSVMSNKSGGTTTDVHGNYTFWVEKDDSIYFSYQGKGTPKFAVQSITAINNFDISLEAKSDLLPEVFVWKRSYQQDSLQNREDYAKVFDYRKPRFKFTPSSGELGGVGAGVDLDALIEIFNAKKKKRMLAFQERLVNDEQEKFIDHRFNKTLVQKLTGLEGERLDSFMKMNKPTYLFAKQANEYDFYEYIKKRAEGFKELFPEGDKNIKTP